MDERIRTLLEKAKRLLNGTNSKSQQDSLNTIISSVKTAQNSWKLGIDGVSVNMLIYQFETLVSQIEEFRTNEKKDFLEIQGQLLSSYDSFKKSGVAFLN